MHYTDVLYLFPIRPPFVPTENPTGIYKRKFELDADWIKQDTILRFYDVDSAYDLWINGTHAGFGKVSRQTAEFDITPYVRETARFWNSRCQYNEEQDRYEIRKVTGPDEWHEPVDNNLYTNYLARWNLKFVRSLLADLKENQRSIYEKLVKKTGLREAELSDWQQHSEKLYLPRKEGSRLLEQFEGYFDLLNVTIEEYDKKDWPIKPAILKTVDKSKTQIIKQADVVMLLHLMGEEFDEETQKENYAYYEKRALHGSSLSPSIYAIMGLKVGDSSKAYRYLRRAPAKKYQGGDLRSKSSPFSTQPLPRMHF